jgi:hypothetical protein
MRKIRSVEIAFKALIHDYAHENGILCERVCEASIDDYISYLRISYPGDENFLSKLPERKLLENWWDDEVGNTAWLREFHDASH